MAQVILKECVIAYSIYVIMSVLMFLVKEDTIFCDKEIFYFTV